MSNARATSPYPFQPPGGFDAPADQPDGERSLFGSICDALRDMVASTINACKSILKSIRSKISSMRSSNKEKDEAKEAFLQWQAQQQANLPVPLPQTQPATTPYLPVGQMGLANNAYSTYGTMTPPSYSVPAATGVVPTTNAYGDNIYANDPPSVIVPYPNNPYATTDPNNPYARTAGFPGRPNLAGTDLNPYTTPPGSVTSVASPPSTLSDEQLPPPRPALQLTDLLYLEEDSTPAETRAQKQEELMEVVRGKYRDRAVELSVAQEWIKLLESGRIKALPDELDGDRVDSYRRIMAQLGLVSEGAGGDGQTE